MSMRLASTSGVVSKALLPHFVTPDTAPLLLTVHHVPLFTTYASEVMAIQGFQSNTTHLQLHIRASDMASGIAAFEVYHFTSPVNAALCVESKGAVCDNATVAAAAFTSPAVHFFEQIITTTIDEDARVMQPVVCVYDRYDWATCQSLGSIFVTGLNCIAHACSCL